VELAASLPDFGNPTTIPLATVVGAFIGAAAGRIRGLPRRRVRALAEDAGFYATGAASVAYLVAVTTNLY